MAFIERLPGPYPVWYAVFAFLMFAAVAVARWAVGLPVWDADLPLRLFTAFMFAFPAGLVPYLNRAAAAAFNEFGPALRSSGEAAILRYRLTTAPALPSFAFSLASAASPVLLLYSAPPLRALTDAIYGPGLAAVFFGALNYFINSHAAYRVIYQVSQVSRIYSRHARVRLSDLGPHFALSGVTSRAAIASILIVSAYVAGFAQVGSLTLALVVLVPNLVLAGAAFVLPLVGAHRLLEAERASARRSASLRMETALAKLHQKVEHDQFSAVPPIKYAIKALDIELNRLAHIPTWPWTPGTLRGVLAAIFLPVVIWLVQYGLQRVLG